MKMMEFVKMATFMVREQTITTFIADWKPFIRLFTLNR